MKWLGVLALCGACGGKDPPLDPGGVSLVLDIPNGVLDPKGFTTVEVVLHAPSGDVVRSANVATDGTFELGSLDPSNMLSVEATLRNDSGASVGYGRTAGATAFMGGAKIVVPVRRPIAYIAGTVSRDADNDARTPGLHWTESPATFSDLTAGGALDGTTQLGSQVVGMVAAGPNLYLITQATSDPSGALIGPAKLAPVSMTDHQIGAMLTDTISGAVIDSAGTDDGETLVIGTTTQLYAVTTATGVVRVLADGNFARVAVAMTDTGEVNAIAIKNRGATTGPCATTAELWWAPLAAGGAAHLVATGGFADVAGDRGHAYYVDACTAQLGEVTSTAPRMLRSLPGPGRPTALAVSNGQAYVGVENQPATTTLLVASIATNDAPRTLWDEAAQQVLKASDFLGVQRQLDASSVVFDHLEIGAGGDYVALSTSAHFHGNPIASANFPDMTIDAEELRVFDAATGGTVQRYRSWCDGVVFLGTRDIENWACASTVGQTAAAAPMYEHHIGSMTFLFGKK
jgi:hypothetical protein